MPWYSDTITAHGSIEIVFSYRLLFSSISQHVVCPSVGEEATNPVKDWGSWGSSASTEKKLCLPLFSLFIPESAV